MREILFRGKCIDNGEWKEGYFLAVLTRNILIHLIWRILQLPEIALTIQNYYRRQRSNGTFIEEPCYERNPGRQRN